MAQYNNALDLYRGVLHDMDKVAAPSFKFRDFNFWINKAIKQYCNRRYNPFDTKQQHIDDLRMAVPDPVTLNLTNKQADLPTDYFHTLRCFVTMEYTQVYNCHPVGEQYVQVCKRLTADLQGFATEDYYQRPKPTRIFYKINKNRIVIHYDTPNTRANYVVARSIELEYLQVPGDMTITSPTVYTLFTGYNCVFPDYVWQEIVNTCVDLFLENVEQQRLQTHIPVNKTIV
jgi:hypothetical protein